MLLVQLTESSARFITGLIAVLIILAFFGWLSQVTGINPFILIGVALLAFAALVVKLMRGTRPKLRTATDRRRCTFIRENGTRCIREKVSSTDLCDHHTTYVERHGTKPAPKEAPVGSVREKRSQCGFIKDDSSKCKKLKPVSVRRCDYHLKLEEAAGK